MTSASDISPLFIFVCLFVTVVVHVQAICMRYVTRTMREKGCMDPTAALRGAPLHRGQPVEVVCGVTEGK